jgi:hypothetical protein
MANNSSLHKVEGAGSPILATTTSKPLEKARTQSPPRKKKYPRIGEFYRVKVAGRDDLTMRELVISDDDTARIEQNLFGYRVVTSKGFLECRSEAEARFLRIFVDLGAREVGVPEDDAFLEKILPEIESLKQRIDRILEPYMLTLNRRLRTELRRSVYDEVAQMHAPSS